MIERHRGRNSMKNTHGFAYQLLQSKQATKNFEKLDEEEKRQVIEAARNVCKIQDICGIISDLENLENRKSN